MEACEFECWLGGEPTAAKTSEATVEQSLLPDNILRVHAVWNFFMFSVHSLRLARLDKNLVCPSRDAFFAKFDFHYGCIT
jgi:hypothetical protein